MIVLKVLYSPFEHQKLCITFNHEARVLSKFEKKKGGGGGEVVPHSDYVNLPKGNYGLWGRREGTSNSVLTGAF